MKKFLSLILAFMLTMHCFIIGSAFQSEDVIEIGGVPTEIKEAVKPLKTKDWTVCIYMCGTDLESKNSAATLDLLEMLSADIPDDVNILVMTGGTQVWNPFEYDKESEGENIISGGAYITPDSEYTQIYSVDDDKMNLIYTFDESYDMGDVCTLEMFMEFSLYYAPSEHLMVSMWNHGGGPLGGVEVDENTKNRISVPEYKAFSEALYKARGVKTDILGFDTCLMGNVETALNIAPYADYMVASADIEPGTGWDYEWMSVFDEANEENRCAEATEVAERIIEMYPAIEEKDWTKATGHTLALYDLSKADAVEEAFNNMTDELVEAASDPELFSQISRRAEDVYSMFLGEEGLLDLYDFACKMSDFLPSSEDVIDALGEIPEGDDKYVGEPDGEDNFVIYRGVSADYTNCLGITFFYPTVRTFIKDEIDAGKQAIKYNDLEMSQAFSDFISELLLKTDIIQHFKGEIELKYDYNSDKIIAQVENTEDTVALSKVEYNLIYTQINEDGTETDYNLGNGVTINDWENGIFEVPFDGKWYALDDEIFTYMLDSGTTSYDKYKVPILMEGDTELSLLTLYVMKDNPSYAYIGLAYEIDYSGNVSRSFMLNEESKFRTVLVEKNDYGMKYEYYTYKPNDNIITPISVEYKGAPELALDVQRVDLANSTDAMYKIQAAAFDSKRDVFYTNVLELYLSQDINTFSIAPIEPQIYTGSPVMPKIDMRYLDKSILMTQAFKVRYENNTEKGTGKVIVEIDAEDLKGELVSEFEIKDVSEIYQNTTNDSWYFDDLVYMQSIGAVPPSKILENDLTRAEFVDMLYNYYSPLSVKEELIFTDVSEDSYYAPAIKWAKSVGIIQGITDKTFAPDKKITRGEMIVMLKRFDDLRGNILSLEEPTYHLADCQSIPVWAEDAMHWAVANEIIKGNDGSILPNDFVKISEGIAMISRCGK